MTLAVGLIGAGYFAQFHAGAWARQPGAMGSFHAVVGTRGHRRRPIRRARRASARH